MSGTDLIEKKAMLMTRYRSFQRWETDGGKPYGYGDHQQLDHDTYHDHISRTDAPNIFYFNIQVYDSPDGDTWWSGKFMVINDIDVQIEEEKYTDQ